MKTLAFLLVLALQSPPLAPLVRLSTALQQLRPQLDEHQTTFGATAELTAAKHQFRDWIESRLASQGERVDVGEVGDTLHAALAAAGLLCGDLSDECGLNFLGYVDDVRVRRAGEFLVVVTAIGVSCGFDESAYVYAWQGQQWRRVWEHERNTYTPQDYRPQIVHDVQISPPDASRSRLLMMLGSQTVCGGAFKDVYARVWRIDSDDRATSVLDWTGHANDAYPPIQGRVGPDAVRFQFTAGGLLSGEVHSAVRHYTVTQGTATQGDPVAGLPRDFVVEWLSAPWEESRTRSATSTLAAVHAELHRNDGVGDFPGATLKCLSGPGLWQVETHLYERPKRYYRVRWQDAYRFTMMDVSDTAYPDCTITDSRGETYTDLLDADLR
ncbi:MAG: hypothetical protein ABI868_18465 [Acidobacteriota bacterium]